MPSVENTTIVTTREDLLDPPAPGVSRSPPLMQDHIPDEVSEDWFSHGYCDGTATARVVFTGRKGAVLAGSRGATAAAYTSVNPPNWRDCRRRSVPRWATAASSTSIGGSICAPANISCWTSIPVRVQFRMFENDAGIDVVRHAPRPVRPEHPRRTPVDGERFVVEPWDLMSLAADPDQPWTGGGGGRAWRGGPTTISNRSSSPLSTRAGCR